MAVWMSWNIDIPRSLNSRDSFPRRKVENRAQKSCSPGPILSPTNIRFEIHAKMAEEIDLEMCSDGQLSEVQHAPWCWPWPWIGPRSHQHRYPCNTYRKDYQITQVCACSVKHYRNMAIWILWNMDIRRRLNCRDSFRRRKFKNRPQTSCSLGPILSLPTINFELHANTVEEIDLEECNFRNFGRSVTLTLILDRVEVTLVCIRGRDVPTHHIRSKSDKLFVDVRTYFRTDGRTRLTSNLL